MSILDVDRAYLLDPANVLDQEQFERLNNMPDMPDALFDMAAYDAENKRREDLYEQYRSAKVLERIGHTSELPLTDPGGWWANMYGHPEPTRGPVPTQLRWPERELWKVVVPPHPSPMIPSIDEEVGGALIPDELHLPVPQAIVVPSSSVSLTTYSNGRAKKVVADSYLRFFTKTYGVSVPKAIWPVLQDGKTYITSQAMFEANKGIPPMGPRPTSLAARKTHDDEVARRKEDYETYRYNIVVQVVGAYKNDTRETVQTHLRNAAIKQQRRRILDDDQYARGDNWEVDIEPHLDPVLIRDVIRSEQTRADWERRGLTDPSASNQTVRREHSNIVYVNEYPDIIDDSGKRRKNTTNDERPARSFVRDVYDVPPVLPVHPLEPGEHNAGMRVTDGGIVQFTATDPKIYNHEKLIANAYVKSGYLLRQTVDNGNGTFRYIYTVNPAYDRTAIDRQHIHNRRLYHVLRNAWDMQMHKEMERRGWAHRTTTYKGRRRKAYRDEAKRKHQIDSKRGRNLPVHSDTDDDWASSSGDESMVSTDSFVQAYDNDRLKPPVEYYVEPGIEEPLPMVGLDALLTGVQQKREENRSTTAHKPITAQMVPSIDDLPALPVRRPNADIAKLTPAQVARNAAIAVKKRETAQKHKAQKEFEKKERERKQKRAREEEEEEEELSEEDGPEAEMRAQIRRDKKERGPRGPMKR